MSFRWLAVSVSSEGESLGIVDDVSIRESAGGPELVVNGDFEGLPWFEGDEGNAPCPPGWYNGGVQSSIEGSQAAGVLAPDSDELSQDILAGVVVPGVEYTISAKLVGRVKLSLFADYDGGAGSHLAPGGWVPFPLVPQGAILFNVDITEPQVFYATFTIPAAVSAVDPGLPPTPLFTDRTEEFGPSVGGGTIAKAGLAIAGLARCGFYPNQTDTITEPAEDPPVFTGGTYAYKKDLEGLE